MPIIEFGPRHGGAGQKGLGFYGPLIAPDGSAVTEYSVQEPVNGRMVEMPTLVPGLTREEVQAILASAATGAPLPPRVYEKAAEHARRRLAQGRSPFWAIPEKQERPPGGLLD